MPGPTDVSEALQFAASVAGIATRGRAAAPATWTPGEPGDPADPALTDALDAIGWAQVADDGELAVYAGLGAVELGRRLSSMWEVDRLLGGSPLSGELVRCLGPAPAMAVRDGVRHAVARSEPVASAEGLDVRRVLELGPPAGEVTAPARAAWLAAGVGYLAGLGEGALAMTVDYALQRRAFGSTLAALGPVQQLLASAATAVRGVRLLAGEPCDESALSHAGPAIAQAGAACQQVSGAIGFTLEYPLHRFTQRARALAAWNDALLDAA
jgi:butyryl-CoA dehydrogenase